MSSKSARRLDGADGRHGRPRPPRRCDGGFDVALDDAAAGSRAVRRPRDRGRGRRPGGARAARTDVAAVAGCGGWAAGRLDGWTAGRRRSAGRRLAQSRAAAAGCVGRLACCRAVGCPAAGAGCRAVRPLAAAAAPLPRSAISASMFSSAARDHADELPDRSRVAFVDEALAQHAVAARDELHDRLVRLDLGEHVAVLHGVAFVLQPFDEAPLFHRGGERLHEDFGCHFALAETGDQ